MAYKIKVKDKVYPIKDGFTIKEELNETLDSVDRLEFETFHEEFNGVPFDHVTIFDENNKISEKHFLVDTYDDEVYSFENDIESNNHHYVLKLFSETKGLERITMPCLSVTQPTSGTKNSVWDYISRYYQSYFPMYKKYTSSKSYPNHYLYDRKYSFTTQLRQKFSDVDCPEFQWNNPTFREVLTDLLSTEDCIPVVRKGEISYYSFKDKGNPIDTSKISYSKRTMSSGDFVGELTLNMKNGIGKSSTTCCEYVMLQAPGDSGTLTTENGVIKTMHPIYSIKKLQIYGFSYDSLTQDINKFQLWNADFASRVKEYEDWNVLSNVKLFGSAYNDLPDGTDANNFTAKEHKVNYLYYDRGGNEIHNVSQKYEGAGLYVDSGFAWTVVMATLMQQGMGVNFPYNGDGVQDVRSLFFYIEYETILDNSLNVGKYLPSPHPENRVFDAQKDSYVDVQHQSIFEYAKVERLGNKIREVYGEYFDESAIPNLGDYIGDEILFSKEVTYFDNIILFKGFLVPHYILKDFYTGVMTKKRSWEIAKGDEALTRRDVYKLYIEASTKVKEDDFEDRNVNPFRIFERMTPNTDSNNTNVIKPFLSAFRDYYRYQNIKHAFVRTRTVGEDFPIDDSSDGIICDVATEVQGKSICFNFGFNDNFKSGEYIIKDGDEYRQSFYKYCSNTTGYMQSADILLIGKTYGIGDGSTPIPDTSDKKPANWVSSFLANNFKRPRFAESAAKYQNDGFKILTLINKDNREIIKWNIQMEYCSDTKDIIVGKRLLEMSSLVNPSSNQVRLNVVLQFSKTPYQLGEEKVHPDSVFHYFDGTALELQVQEENDYSCKVQWITNYQPILDDWAEYPYWAITDFDGNILLASNVKNSSSVYFNLLRSRDTKVYMNSWSQEVAGDISNISHITPVE